MKRIFGVWPGLLLIMGLPAVAQSSSADTTRNVISKAVSDDLRIVAQDMKDADGAHATAMKALGSKAGQDALDAREAEIKTAKYQEVEALMLKDTAANQDVSILWTQLGVAESGLKKYEAAEAAYKKAIALESDSAQANGSVAGLANSGLGEVYARTGKVDEARGAFDAAVKANPARAGLYLRNEAVIFFQANNPDAQVAAANEAIALDPDQPILYYLKGNGLGQKATVDATTKKLIPPPGCVEAYRQYLKLAPDGAYVKQVKTILANFEEPGK